MPTVFRKSKPDSRARMTLFLACTHAQARYIYVLHGFSLVTQVTTWNSLIW
jgi:hypothetical protein